MKREGTMCVAELRRLVPEWRGKGSTNIRVAVQWGTNSSFEYADLTSRDGNSVWQRRYEQSVSKNILKPGVPLFSRFSRLFFATKRGLPLLASVIGISFSFEGVRIDYEKMGKSRLAIISRRYKNEYLYVLAFLAGRKGFLPYYFIENQILFAEQGKRCNKILKKKQ